MEMLTTLIPLEGTHKFHNTDLEVVYITPTRDDWAQLLHYRPVIVFTIQRYDPAKILEQIDKVIDTIVNTYQPDKITLYHWGKPARMGDHLLEVNQPEHEYYMVKIAVWYEKGNSKFILRRLDAKQPDSLIQVE